MRETYGDPANLPDDEQVVLGIEQQHKGAWTCHLAAEVMDHNGAVYACVSTQGGNPGSTLISRGVDNARGVFILVLDDVGEDKVDKETSEIFRIKEPPLKPSFILQTSPESEQWLYVLDEPLYGEAAHHMYERCHGALAEPSTPRRSVM